jgi:hypothetical protein
VLAVADLAAPVVIVGAAGHWELHHGPSMYRAEFHPRGSHRARPAPWAASAVVSWELEGLIGVALPPPVHAYLDRVTTSEERGWFAPDGPPPAAARPARPDTITVGEWRGSYGRLLHASPVEESWAEGPYRVDLVGAVGVLDGQAYLAHRVWHHGRVVHASTGLLVPLDMPVHLGDTLTAAVAGAVARAISHPDDWLPAEQAWLADDGLRLLSHLASTGPPYLPGRRIVVEVGDYREPAGGVVVDLLSRPDGTVTGYRWRPDAYNLPGHPYRDQPARVLFSPAEHVHTDLFVPDEPDARLAYGARITTIDHPTVRSGTVLRGVCHRDGTLSYEIEPDGPVGGTVWLHENDVEVVTGAAWPTVSALLAARRAAGGPPLTENEQIVTVRETATVRRGPAGALALEKPMSLDTTDPLIDPAASVPATLFQVPPTAPAAAGLMLEEPAGGPLLFDPDRGALAVPTGPFAAALHRSADDLRRLLAGHRPDLATAEGATADGADPTAAHRLLAAIAAVEIPDRLTALPDPQPPPPGPAL